MKRIILLHNPSAGDEDHTKSDLIRAIENEGYRCAYFSIKEDEGWKDQLEEADLVVVAGGDGTVRRAVKEIVQGQSLSKEVTMALLPMGTANNLSKTLAVDKDVSFVQHAKSWKDKNPQRFDIGITTTDGDIDFFLEGAGYGLFPMLIQTMESVDSSELENAEDALQLALEKLHQIIQTAEASHYTIHIDDEIQEGNYLLVEVMNIPSIGPNLILAPAAQTDDGCLDLVVVAETQRDAFARYIEKLIRREPASFDFQTFCAKKFVIISDHKNMHIDDEYIASSKSPLTVTVREHIVDFLK